MEAAAVRTVLTVTIRVMAEETVNQHYVYFHYLISVGKTLLDVDHSTFET